MAEPGMETERWPDLPVILLIGAFLVAAGAVALTYGTTRWIGHAVTAFTGLALMIAAVLSGAVQKGRIRRIHIRNAYRFHRMASIGFCLFVIGAYVLGILTTMKFGGQLVKYPHGVVGLILVLMAVVQLVPSLLVKKRAGIQTLHRFIGYALVPAFILELIIGLFRARIL
jgi:hypothetical protein